MAFQTSFLRNGQWVIEKVKFQSALRYAAASSAATVAGGGDNATPQSHSEPSICGVLSQTIVESPVIRWILPVRLRSKSHNDVAFIGDCSVKINELRRDGQVHEVAHKRDFGSRIRSALVLGDPLDHALDDQSPAPYTKPNDGDAIMSNVPEFTHDNHHPPIPSQLLVLMLESGMLVFLFVKHPPGSTPQFIISTYELSSKAPFLGHHLAADPSSHYLTAASPDGVLVIIELEDMATIGAQYITNGFFYPIKSERLRLIRGVIHKTEFLHPRLENGYHIILSLIIIRRETSRDDPVTRMVIYEWELGDCLRRVFSGEKLGSRLPHEQKMPLLLIPLRFSTAFFTVSEEHIGIVKHCLSGSPVFELLCADIPGPTGLHHGAHEPLWTAWARPFRRRKYFETTDIIYLAREDGAIIHIEIEAMDLVPSVTNVGCLSTNINTAFTTAYDIFSDILIIGGDSGPGSIWKIAPHTDLEQVSNLPNWSPVVDATTTSYSPQNVDSTVQSSPGSVRAALAKPVVVSGSLYTTSGRGLKGDLTQWRWGVQCRIGLDVESGEPIKRLWAFDSENTEEIDGLFALLVLPLSSAMLRFSDDLSQVSALSFEETHFDLTSRTLDTCVSPEGMIIQVTESSVTVKSRAQSWHFSLEKLLPTNYASVETACCADKAVVISTHSDQGSQLHALDVTQEHIVQHHSTWEIKGDVTCIRLFGASTTYIVIVGSVLDGIPWISVYSLEGMLITSEVVTESTVDPISEIAVRFEPFTSICLVQKNDTDEAYFALGTRCGHLMNMKLTQKGAYRITLAAEKIGMAPVEVFSSPEPFNGLTVALICCDSALIMMTNFSMRDGKFHSKHHVWFTDANNLSMPSPPIHAVCSLRRNVSGYPGHLSLIAQSGSRLLLAEMRLHVSIVPRSIPVHGSPTRVLYSQTWNCLIVALILDGKPTLAFIDPESGETISTPSDREGNDLAFIAGLGHSGDRIFCLHEWLYVKDGKTFSFIIVATKDGRLLIVSVKMIKSRAGRKDVRRLRYSTRHKRALGQPIYSVVSDEQGIIFCVKKTIHWEVLDLTEKKLRAMGEYVLDSPATSLQVVGGRILALTTLHSLEVIDYKGARSGSMSLTHSDHVSRRTVHMLVTGELPSDGRDWPMTLLSDQEGGIVGVRIPWQQGEKEFDVIFEAFLRSSVRRFVQHQGRSPWLADTEHSQYRTLTNSQDGANIFGVSVDGSLRHFTLLGFELWRFLCLIQNMAARSPEASCLIESGEECEIQVNEGDRADTSIRPVRNSKSMHIDGDILERCLQRRVLETMVQRCRGFDLYREYLDALEAGRYTRGLRDQSGMRQNEKNKGYIELGYDVLAYLLNCHAI